MTEMFRFATDQGLLPEKQEFQDRTSSGQVLQDRTFPDQVQPQPTPSHATGTAEALGPMQEITTMAQVVGTTTVRFSFDHFGGTNNLKPGRPETLRAHINRPEGAQAFVALSKINCGFINGNLGNPQFGLRERPLGQLGVETFIDGDDVVCFMLLTDTNGDDPCVMRVEVNVLFFR